MINALLFSGILLIISVLSSKLLYRFGIPTLLIFISLGMLLGSDGIGGIYFDNYEIAQQLSTLSLVFIMFYGGFGFNWKTGKPVAAICHGPWMLASADAIKDKEVTSFFSIKDDMIHAGGIWVDKEVVVSDNILTSRNPGDLPALMKKFVEMI